VAQAQEPKGELLKHEAQRLRKAEAALKPFQDEKLGHMEHQHVAGMEAFKMARNARNSVADEYGARAQEIGQKIDAMHARADKEAHQCLESMKGLAVEFDASVAKGKREWRLAFNERKKENTAANEAAEEKISKLDADIQEEHEACLAYSTAEIEPIEAALREHGKVLTQQIEERELHQKELREETAKEFGRLRQRLQREKERRERQCKESRQAAEGPYQELAATLEKEHASVRERLASLSERVAAEKGERAEAHQAIVQKMEHIMDELNKNMTNVRQGASEHKQRLENLRQQLFKA
jgi:hypothetical protein